MFSRAITTGKGADIQSCISRRARTFLALIFFFRTDRQVQKPSKATITEQREDDQYHPPRRTKGQNPKRLCPSGIQ